MKLNQSAILGVILLSACTVDDPVEPNGVDFSGGIYITNEGPFQGGNGTLTYYDPSTNATIQNVFNTNVSRPLGNIVHSAHIFENDLFVAVNNSGVVEKVHSDDMTSPVTYTGFQQPRYVHGVESNVIAVTDWGTNTVTFVDVTTTGTLGTVNVGNGPERMLQEGARLYVANSGGFGLDSTVMMIDVDTRTIIDTFYVGYNPNSMAMDINGDLWVLCGGYTDWQNSANNRIGSLYKIDPITGAVLDYFEFDASPRPTALCISSSDQTLYYLDNAYGGQVFAMDIYETSLPLSPLLMGVNGYSIAVDRNANELYVTDPVDYSSQGRVFRYDLINQQMVDTIAAGIIPGNVVFN